MGTLGGIGLLALFLMPTTGPRPWEPAHLTSLADLEMETTALTPPSTAVWATGYKLRRCEGDSGFGPAIISEYRAPGLTEQELVAFYDQQLTAGGWQRPNVEPWEATGSTLWRKKAAKGELGFELRTPYAGSADFGTSVYAQDYNYSDCP